MPLSMCRWMVSVDDVLQRHGTPSQTEPASTPEAIQDQQSSGGPSEKYQCTGAPKRSGAYWPNDSLKSRFISSLTRFRMWPSRSSSGIGAATVSVQHKSVP